MLASSLRSLADARASLVAFAITIPIARNAAQFSWLPRRSSCSRCRCTLARCELWQGRGLTSRLQALLMEAEAGLAERDVLIADVQV